MFVIKGKFDDKATTTRTLFAEYNHFEQKRIYNSEDIQDALKSSYKLWLDDCMVYTSNIESIKII